MYINVPPIAPAQGFQCPVDLHCGDFNHIRCSEYSSLERYSPQDQLVWRGVSKLFLRNVWSWSL